MDIWKRRADGTGEDSLVVDPQRSAVEIAVTPDGSQIVFRAAAPPSRDLLVQPIGPGGAETLLLGSEDFDEVAPALSPDGRWLADASFETGVPQIYVRPFPEVNQGRWQVSSGSGGMAPVWSHGGDELFYGTSAGWTVARIDTSSGFRVVSQDVIDWPLPVPPVSSGVAGGWFDLSRDDQRILAVRSAIGAGQATVVPELILVQNFFQELRARVPN